MTSKTFSFLLSSTIFILYTHLFFCKYAIILIKCWLQVALRMNYFSHQLFLLRDDKWVTKTWPWNLPATTIYLESNPCFARSKVYFNSAVKHVHTNAKKDWGLLKNAANQKCVHNKSKFRSYFEDKFDGHTINANFIP